MIFFFFFFLETTFLGPRKYGVKIPSEILERSKNVSKTPEKLVLNIIKYVLTDYEIKNCTVFGNKQFKKEALPEQKRKAIRSKYICMVTIKNYDSLYVIEYHAHIYIYQPTISFLLLWKAE